MSRLVKILATLAFLAAPGCASNSLGHNLYGQEKPVVVKGDDVKDSTFRTNGIVEINADEDIAYSLEDCGMNNIQIKAGIF